MHFLTHCLNLSKSQKLTLFILFVSVALGILGVCIAKPLWLFSLLCGMLSYIILMAVTFFSVRTKILQKIEEADTQEKLEKYASKYDTDEKEEYIESSDSISCADSAALGNETTKSIHTESTNAESTRKKSAKERLRFLDLSKASLGFELSFSLPRIFTFIGMIACFVLLVFFQVFFPLVYIFGVFLGVVVVVCVLFFMQEKNSVLR